MFLFYHCAYILYLLVQVTYVILRYKIKNKNGYDKQY